MSLPFDPLVAFFLFHLYIHTAGLSHLAQDEALRTLRGFDSSVTPPVLRPPLKKPVQVERLLDKP